MSLISELALILAGLNLSLNQLNMLILHLKHHAASDSSYTQNWQTFLAHWFVLSLLK
jgi:hypothetical protein